jgi:chromosomal replication initiation ATPase DnaA
MAVVAAETARLRQRHMEHILAMIYEGISMRLIRRHGLDAPLLPDDGRAVLVRALMDRRKKARIKPRENLANRINIASLLNPRALDITRWDSQVNAEPSQAFPQRSQRVTDPHELQRTIEAIRRRVSEYFQMATLRDPDLKVRSHRQVYTFPRQLAMYVARQLTGASLEEIARHFGGRHYTTVLHSIEKIEKMRHLSKGLNTAIADMMNSCGTECR